MLKYQKYILEQVLFEGSTAQNGQKVLKIAKIHYPTRGLSRPSPTYRASQDLKIPFKTLKSAYFYLKHEHIPQKYILEQVLSEGSTAQNALKVLKIAKITKIAKKHKCPEMAGRPLWRPKKCP